MPFPSVFNKIDGVMKERLANSSLIGFIPNTPSDAKVHSFDGRVESSVFQSPKGGPGIRVKGIFDSLLSLGAAGFCLVALKTVQPSPKLSKTFSNQLHEYTFVLDNPSIGENRLAPVSRLGLICFGPTRFTARADGLSALFGMNTWLEIERNDSAFFAFLDEVAEVLASDTCPRQASFARLAITSSEFATSRVKVTGSKWLFNAAQIVLVVGVDRSPFLTLRNRFSRVFRVIL